MQAEIYYNRYLNTNQVQAIRLPETLFPAS